jgi:hypothetical protein
MQIAFLSELGLPSSQTWIVLAVGIVTAWITLFSCFMLVRHRRLARMQDGEQAELHDPFDQGSVGERRVAARRKGNPVEILVTDAETQGEPVLGWVVDRSLSGLSLMLSEELAEGTILSVKPRQHPPATPWVKVQVRNCTRDSAGFVIGCEFERVPPWGVLLLFG